MIFFYRNQREGQGNEYMIVYKHVYFFLINIYGHVT